METLLAFFVDWVPRSLVLLLRNLGIFVLFFVNLDLVADFGVLFQQKNEHFVQFFVLLNLHFQQGFHLENPLSELLDHAELLGLKFLLICLDVLLGAHDILGQFVEKSLS